MILIHDYLEQLSKETGTGKETEIRLPKSNVLQFLLEDGSKISIRPSGTEPKIKFYFSVKEQLESLEAYPQVKTQLEKKIDNFKEELNLV